jgi:ferritin-like metal-binding protein YciE
MGLMNHKDYPSLLELYIAQLQDLLSAENQIEKALPKMIEHSVDLQLKRAFQTHLRETELHAKRLERLIGDFTNDSDGKKDSIVAAIVSLGENIAKETTLAAVRDSGLIATAQKVEHYEIASYNSARDWAIQLGLFEHAAILERTLQEEEHADRVFTDVSERTNPPASVAA